MHELNGRIERLETRCAQMLAHLRSIDGGSSGAALARCTLLTMLENLASLKAERQRRD
jgi:hypothetical protein